MFSLDKHMIPIMITATLLTVIFIFFMIVFLITFKNRQNRKSREYLQALVDEKERTMYTISLELHDNISQMLNVARMNIHWLEDIALNENVPLVQKVGEILDSVIIDTHNIGHMLNTEYLKKKGLISSLKETVIWLNTAKKIKCELTIEGQTKKFRPQTEVMIFRIAQEAIQNTIKYAQAGKMEIRLAYNTGDFEMSVADNGNGFDYHSPVFKEGVGMISMRQRTRIIEGKLSIVSAPGKGTIVSVAIPH